MKISVFGSTGFIGSNFCRMFGYGNEIYNAPRYSRRSQPDSETLWLISTTHNYNVHKLPTLDVETNLVTLCEGLESFKNNNPNGVFNFVSSWFVYGDHGGNFCSEISSCYPKGFYSITKRCAEQLLISYCNTFNLKYRIFRLGNVIGPGDNPTPQKNALQYLIERMYMKLPIHVYNSGLFYRNYMHVDDTCSAMYHLMSLGDESVNKIYNVGHPVNSLFLELLEMAKVDLKYPLEFEVMEPTEFHKKVQTTSFKMDTTQLNLTNWNPVYNMPEAIHSVCEHIKHKHTIIKS